jgi:hypothetical protein
VRLFINVKEIVMKIKHLGIIIGSILFASGTLSVLAEEPGRHDRSETQRNQITDGSNLEQQHEHVRGYKKEDMGSSVTRSNAKEPLRNSIEHVQAVKQIEETDGLLRAFDGK